MTWKKGESGNPGGVYKTKAFTDALRIQLLAMAGDKFGLAEGHRRIDVVAMQLVKKAMNGDMTAIKECADRIEGKPDAMTSLSNADGSNITFMPTIVVQGVEAINVGTNKTE